jgi:DNA-binding LacI/PurR family transcriptional regulator
LIDAGCRRLAFATVSGNTISRRDKIDGFLAAAGESGLAGSAMVMEGKAESEYGDTELTELGIKLAREISAMSRRPDGVVAINDMMAIGLIAGFRKCGLKVPDDISVVGIDDMMLSALISPAITTVRPPVQEMASLAVTRLMARLADPSLPVADFLFTPTLVKRESVRIRT